MWSYATSEQHFKSGYSTYGWVSCECAEEDGGRWPKHLPCALWETWVVSELLASASPGPPSQAIWGVNQQTKGPALLPSVPSFRNSPSASVTLIKWEKEFKELLTRQQCAWTGFSALSLSFVSRSVIGLLFHSEFPPLSFTLKYMKF